MPWNLFRSRDHAEPWDGTAEVELLLKGGARIGGRDGLHALLQLAEEGDHPDGVVKLLRSVEREMKGEQEHTMEL